MIICQYSFCEKLITVLEKTMTLHHTSVVIQSRDTGNFFLEKKGSEWQLGGFRKIEIFSPIQEILDELQERTGIKIDDLTCINTPRPKFFLFHSWVNGEPISEGQTDCGWFPLYSFPEGDFNPIVNWILTTDHFLKEIISPPS